MKRKIRRKIEKKGPLTGKEICKALPEVNESTVRGHLAEMRGRSLLTLPKYEEGAGWVYLHFLEDQKKEALEKSGYMPLDKIEEWLHLCPQANRIRSVIKEFRSMLLRNPTPEEIATKMKKPPENRQFQDLIYRAGKGMETEWGEPTEKEIKDANTRLERILMKAAWEENGLNFESEKGKWKENSIKKISFEGGKSIWVTDPSLQADADKYREKFPHLIPAVEVNKYKKKWIYNFGWKNVEESFRKENIGEILESLKRLSVETGVFESLDGEIKLISKNPVSVKEIQDPFQKLKNHPEQEKLCIKRIREIGVKRGNYPANPEAFRTFWKELEETFLNPERLNHYEHRLHIFRALSGLLLREFRDRREIAEELGYLNSEMEEKLADIFVEASEIEGSKSERVIQDIRDQSIKGLTSLVSNEERRINQVLDLFKGFSEKEASTYKDHIERGIVGLAPALDKSILRKKLKKVWKTENGKKKTIVNEWLNDDRIFPFS